MLLLLLLAAGSPWILGMEGAEASQLNQILATHAL